LALRAQRCSSTGKLTEKLKPFSLNDLSDQAPLAASLPRPSVMIRRPGTPLPALFALLSTGFISACSRGQASPTVPPPPTVSVIELAPETVPLVTEWVATLDGFVNAQVRPQVPGYLVKTTYREGSLVRKGDVLFEIDPRPFEIALAQAEAGVAQAQAQLGRTERDLERDRPLAEQRAIAQSQLDNDIQANLAAQAGLKAAEASVNAARLNVEFTKVRSLIDGVAAIATAQIGDLVSPTTLLTTVSQVDPIRAYFSLSEQEYLTVAARINARGPRRSLWDTGAPLTLTLANEQPYPHAGSFLAADRQIDARTGTIRISASFPNPDRLLRPGQYGRVRAETKVARDAILVPQRAVNDMQGTRQVRIVDAQNLIQLKAVTLGARTGSRWIVEQGLAAGDRVVMDSASLPPGTRVNVRSFVSVPTGAAAAAGVPAATMGQKPEGRK
jgi:membrane fusion protein (multidrug efflux system)